MYGIDVSEWQENINWDLVKTQIDFAILKLGNIGDNRKFWTDPKFERNYNECMRLGIPVGVYLYCYSNEVENAQQAAREVVEYLKNKKIQLPVYIDMEDTEIAPEGKDKLTNICIGFNTIIEQSGRWAGVYANLNWFTNYLRNDVIRQKYTTWIAHPENANNLDKYKGQYDMFQYSFKGKINGISGNIDMNYLYRDLINEIAGNTPQPTPEPQSAKKSKEEIADEVIAGRWGNGQDRVNNLTNAGYDYNTIQDIVNQKLGYQKETIYVVQPGDTLSKIAAKFGTTYQEIARKNGITNPNLIFPNQKLKI